MKSKTNKLQKVRIDKRDTCLSYALKRVGLYDNVQATFVTQLSEEFDFIPYEPEEVKVGDLVTWNIHQKEIEVPWEIDAHLTLITAQVVIDFHIGVVESVEPIGKAKISGWKVMISDCTRRVFAGVPSLRIRDVGRSDGKVREPDFILRLKQDD